MKTRASIMLVIALAAGPAAQPAVAATYVVDDSASLPVESTAVLRWRQAMPTRAGDDLMEGGTTVAVRLNLAPWVNRQARLYLVLPEQGTALVHARWRTQGRLLPGEIAPGQRVVVYQGRIPSAYLDETLTFAFQADGSRLPGLQRLAFHFEIDTE
jgi:hypothetical protein